MPPAGAKKVKTTKELLEEIQSRAGKAPASPTPPGSPDVMLIEPTSCPVKVESPLRNGSSEPRPPSRLEEVKPEPEPEDTYLPLEDEREYFECTCEELTESEECPARRARDRAAVRPLHVRALHHAYLPGVNGTRAPLHPHQFAVRKPYTDDRPDLFASVVPLYKYSDYADDYCVKNMDKVPLCTHLPWTEFAPPPPSPPRLPSPPPPRPYPIDEPPPPAVPSEAPPQPHLADHQYERKVEAEMVSVPTLEPSERLKAPLLSAEEATQFGAEPAPDPPPEEQFASEQQEHRTVERTKAPSEERVIDGRALVSACMEAVSAVPVEYSQLHSAPVLALPEDPSALEAALEEAAADTPRDALGRPARAAHFAEWHECARLGALIALPYVVID